MTDGGPGKRGSKRVIAAFAAGPLAAAGLSATLIFLLGKFPARPGDFTPVQIAAVFFVEHLMVGYLACIVLGVPGYFLLRRAGWSRRPHWFLLGAMIGILAVVLLGLSVQIFNPASIRGQTAAFVVGIVLLSFVSALVTGLIFAWLIRARRVTLDEVASTFD